MLMPAYNGERYLREAIDSVLAQTFSDFELVIVDDRSSDQTFSIAQSYAAKDHRIRLERNNHNLGLVNNWSRCVDLAKGEWIKFVFQDDLLTPDCLEKMIAAVTGEDLMVVCKRDLLFEDVDEQYKLSLIKYIEKHSIEVIVPGITRLSAADICRIAIEYMGKNFIGEPTVVMLHRNVFRQFGRFNPDFIQICDLEYWLRVGVNTGLVYVPEKLATFRVHSSATTLNNKINRRYRYNYLDNLLLQYQFVFYPAFQPIRVAAARRRPPCNLLNILGATANNAYDFALREAAQSENADKGSLRTWESLIVKSPKLERAMRKDKLKNNILRLMQWFNLRS